MLVKYFSLNSYGQASTELLGLMEVEILITACLFLRIPFCFFFVCLYGFKNLHADCGGYNCCGKDPSWKLKHTQRRKLNSTCRGPSQALSPNHTPLASLEKSPW